MIVTESILEQLTWQSSADTQVYWITRSGNKAKLQWDRLVMLLLAITLHIGGLSLILTPPNPTNVVQPMVPMQVSLIKAEENIPNVPVVEKQKVPHKVKPQNKPIVKKKLPFIDEPLVMSEPVSKMVEQVTEDKVEIAEPSQTIQSETEADVVPYIPVYEPPKFGVSYLNNPAPVYPAEAKRKQQQGVVMLRVLVNESGTPEQIEVSESSAVQSLDNAALDAVKKWTFIPAKVDSQAIPAYVIVPIRFNLERRF